MPRSHLQLFLLLSSLLATLSTPALAQVAWDKVPGSTPGILGRAVYDTARQRAVLVASDRPQESLGALDLWDWQDGDWVAVPTSQSPSEQNGQKFTAAYDSARQRLVVFDYTRPQTETWEWDGTAWTLVATAQAPQVSGWRAGMVFDPASQRVLFAAEGATWQWDGVDWTQLFPATNPPNVDALVYDAFRGRIVLSAWGSNLWEWVDSDWEKQNPSQSPSPRSNPALAYDGVRQSIVLFGGGVGLSSQSDMWEWDGSDWTELQPPTRPRAGAYAMVWDASRGRVVSMGGRNTFNLSLDTWEWNGTHWTEFVQTVHEPGVRYDQGSTYDRARDVVVLFGGSPFSSQGGAVVGQRLNDTWEFDGTAWEQKEPLTVPPARSDHGMAYDPVRGVTVMYGGIGGMASPTLADTWEWDGTSWTELFPAASPGVRHGQAMAWDPVRESILLFGGADGTNSGGGGARQADTWEWNGTNWTQLFPATSPQARIDAVMATDERRARIVLFGGEVQNQFRTTVDDTWEWDGTDWTQTSVAAPPIRTINHSMVYDSHRGRVVQYVATASQGQAWEWDGAAWINRSSTPAPPFFEEPSLAYHEGTARAVILGVPLGFGGCCGGPAINDTTSTWLYGGTQLADYQPFGAGCSGSAGTPVLRAAPFERPWIGGSFTVEISNLPIGRPAGMVFGGGEVAHRLVEPVRVETPPGLARAVRGLRLPSDRPSPCVVYSHIGAYYPIVNNGGTATFTIYVPNEAALVGLQFDNQVVAADPAGVSGVVVSNAAVGTIGDR